MKVIFALVLFSMMAWDAEGVCCPAYGHGGGYGYGYGRGGHCLDGTLGTPYCGRGPCNFFGCNCDYGCRTYRGGRGRRDTTNQDVLIFEVSNIHFALCFWTCVFILKSVDCIGFPWN